MDGYSFTVAPPKSVTDYLANKKLEPRFSWQDIWAEEHAFAFTVAKATELNVLNDIFEEIQTSLAEGKPFSEFKKDLTPRLKARGWWGEKDIPELDAKGNPTGRIVSARLGSPRRLQTIYWANVRTARAAGQWQRIQETKDFLPYLSYELGPSEVHRPLHEDKEGTVLLADDPFWNEWFAPNGWGCKCWHRQVSVPEARRLGVSKSPDIPRITYKNARTGEVTSAPQGIDPGWNTNPGRTRETNMRRFMAGALDRSPQAFAQVAIKDLLGDSEFKAHMRGERLTAWPIAVLDQETADLVESKSRTVFFSQSSASRHNDLILNKSYPKPELFALIQEWLPRAQIKSLKTKPNAAPKFHFSFVAADGQTYWGVFKVVNGDEIFLLSYYSKGRNLKGREPRGQIVRVGEE